MQRPELRRLLILRHHASSFCVLAWSLVSYPHGRYTVEMHGT
jgi:hypothetical protein